MIKMLRTKNIKQQQSKNKNIPFRPKVWIRDVSTML